MSPWARYLGNRFASDDDSLPIFKIVEAGSPNQSEIHNGVFMSLKEF